MWPHRVWLLAAPPWVGPCSSKMWPQKHRVAAMARAQGTERLALLMSRISQAPQTQTTLNFAQKRLPSGVLGGAGRACSQGLEGVAAPAGREKLKLLCVRPKCPRRHSLALAMAWKRRVASSGSFP